MSFLEDLCAQKRCTWQNVKVKSKEVLKREIASGWRREMWDVYSGAVSADI